MIGRELSGKNRKFRGSRASNQQTTEHTLLDMTDTNKWLSLFKRRRRRRRRRRWFLFYRYWIVTLLLAWYSRLIVACSPFSPLARCAAVARLVGASFPGIRSCNCVEPSLHIVHDIDWFSFPEMRNKDMWIYIYIYLDMDGWIDRWIGLD